MTWIETVSPDEARGIVRQVYDSSLRRFGFVPNIRRALSLNPDALKAYGQLSGAAYGTGVLPPDEREMIALVVSAVNDCHY